MLKLLNFYVGYIGPLPPLFAGIYAYRYLTGAYAWLFRLICFAVIMQWVSRIFVMQGYYNVPLLHFYVPAEFMLYSMVYAHLLHGFIHKRYIYGTLAVFIVFSGVNTLMLDSLVTFNNYVRGIGSLILIIYAIGVYVKLMKDLNADRLRTEPVVWINTAVCLYFAGSFFVFILSNLIQNHSVTLSLAAWRINSVVSIVYYLMIAFGFLLVRRNALKSTLKPLTV